MRKEDTLFLSQLAKSLDDLSAKLEEFYKGNDVDGFNRAKSAMLGIQKKILGVSDAG